MPPEPQELESAFEPVERDEAGSGQGAEPSAHDEITTFFERLNALDDMSWSSQSGPAHTGPAAAAGSGAAAGQRTAAKAAHARMRVLRSDSAAVKGLPTQGSAAGRTPAAPRDDADSLDGRRHSRAGNVVRLGIAGLLLFGIGIGGGWAALSLPSRFDHAMPGLTRLLEKGFAPQSVAQVPPEAEPRDTIIHGKAGSTPEGTAPAHAAAATAEAAKPAKSARPRAARARPAAKGRTVVAKRIRAPKPPAPPPALTSEPAPRAAAAHAGNAQSQQAPAGRPARTASAPAAPRPPAAPAAATSPQGDGQYAIQVGACTSYACVQNYRKLLLNTVSAHRIQVTAQHAENGRTIQRIRVAPLDKAEALRIKEALAASDPRLKNAYLIAVQ